MARTARREKVVNMSPPEIDPLAPTAGPMVNQKDIARRAYEIYLSRGAAHGADLDDWLRAEREMRGARSTAN